MQQLVGRIGTFGWNDDTLEFQDDEPIAPLSQDMMSADNSTRLRSENVP